MWHNVMQNTEEPCPCCGKTWHQLRSGKITGSTVGKMMAKPKTKSANGFGDPAKKQAVDLVVCHLGGQPEQNTFSNHHMERGNEQEPIARMLYEKQTFSTVKNGGFFDDGIIRGSSPDGLVGGNGVIEIKSVINSTHFACIKRNKFDPKYKWQLAWNLKQSGRDWIDYISYCATFPKEGRLFIHRITKEDFEEEFFLIDERLKEYFNFLRNLKTKMKNYLEV